MNHEARALEDQREMMKLCELRVKMRSLGSAYGIELPPMGQPGRTYSMERTAMYADIMQYTQHLRALGAKSPEKQMVIQEAASRLLDLLESFGIYKEG